MSDFYKSFRNEIAAGGAVDDGADKSTRQGRLIGVLMLAGLAYLAVRSPWAAVFVVGLLASVFLHEVGHFWTARRTGMKATQFFMGFGPRVFSFTRGETEYGVRALPLGAFVRIIGMNNLDDVEPQDEDHAYRSKSYPRRLLVITAGSLMHMVIALVLFAGVYMTWGGETHSGRAVVQGLYDGGPAADAGIKNGDTLVSVGGTTITDYDSLVRTMEGFAPGDSVIVEYLSGGDNRSARVVLDENTAKAGRAFLGVYASDWVYKRLSPFTAVVRGIGDIGYTARESAGSMVTVLNPVNMIRQVADTNAPVEERPTTVVGMSRIGGTVGREDGMAGVLRLLAFVNVFVGAFNMIPLLPFDGGHAAMATYERIRSRRGRPYRADAAKMIPVATAVVGLLLLLFVTGLYLDIARPIG